MADNPTIDRGGAEGAPPTEATEVQAATRGAEP